MTEERLTRARELAKRIRHDIGWVCDRQTAETMDGLLTHIDALQQRIAELEADTVWANFSPATVRTETATAILRDIGDCNCDSCERMRDICRAHGAKE